MFPGQVLLSGTSAQPTTEPRAAEPSASGEDASEGTVGAGGDVSPHYCFWAHRNAPPFEIAIPQERRAARPRWPAKPRGRQIHDRSQQ